jgi:hypothetical protein
VLFALPGAGLLQALDQPPGVGGDPEQVRCFFQGLVVRAGEEHGVPAPGGDLDGVRSSLTCSMSGNRFFRASPN